MRKEVTKNSRYYFYDNGVRNSLIQNLNPLAVSNDIGQLWENFLLVERRKANQLAGRSVNAYFWRTFDQKEIDYIEEHSGKLYAFEFKWQPGELRKSVQQEFLNAYPDAMLEIIRRDNFEEFTG